MSNTGHTNIQKTKNSYTIIKRISGDTLTFGSFKTLKEAIQYKEEVLVPSNWDLKYRKRRHKYKSRYDEKNLIINIDQELMNKIRINKTVLLKYNEYLKKNNIPIEESYNSVEKYIEDGASKNHRPPLLDYLEEYLPKHGIQLKVEGLLTPAQQRELLEKNNRKTSYKTHEEEVDKKETSMDDETNHTDQEVTTQYYTKETDDEYQNFLERWATI